MRAPPILYHCRARLLSLLVGNTYISSLEGCLRLPKLCFAYIQGEKSRAWEFASSHISAQLSLQL